MPLPTFSVMVVLVIWMSVGAHCGALLDIVDTDGDGLGEGVSGRVGDADLDIVAGGGLEVEEAAVGDDDVAAVEAQSDRRHCREACR